MTLTRATVEQMRDDAHEYQDDEVEALAEGWLRQQEALQEAKRLLDRGAEFTALEVIRDALRSRPQTEEKPSVR